MHNWRELVNQEQGGNIFNAVKDFTMLPNKHLQDKIDYFITPYNTEISMQKHMEFEDDNEK